jgi:hypothetical protein
MEYLGLLCPVAIVALLVALGILFYVLAVASRKSYRCPSCGEQMTVEHMRASHCNMCGAPLERKET